MPELFPTTETEETNETKDTEVQFGQSWRFDFEKGEFVLTPTGSVAETDDVDAWIEWCRKALQTTRYRHLVYSRSYGHEFEDLISRNLTREGNESEIKRIVSETLMLDPRTSKVDGFKFQWNADEVTYTFEVTNTRGETGTLTGRVVIT